MHTLFIFNILLLKMNYAETKLNSLYNTLFKILFISIITFGCYKKIMLYLDFFTL